MTHELICGCVSDGSKACEEHEPDRTFTVAELIAELSKLPPHLPVWAIHYETGYYEPVTKVLVDFRDLKFCDAVLIIADGEKTHER